MRGTPPALWLLVVMTGLGPFTMQIVVPVLPQMARDLGVSYGVAQLTLTLYLVGVALGQLLYGPLSDRFGRRPVLLWALALFILSSVLAALAPSAGWLVAARVAQAAGACSGMVLGRAIIRDVWPREEAASRLGYVILGMTVAPMLSPSMGAFLEAWLGWRVLMLACALAGIPVLFAAWRSLRETLAVPQPLPGIVGMAEAYGSLLRLESFRWIAFVGCVANAVFFCFLAGAPLVSDRMGNAPADYAVGFLAISATFALGSWIAGRFSTRLGVARMLSLGLIVISVGAAVMALVKGFVPAPREWGLTMLFGPMMIVAVGNGMSLPNSVAAAVSVRPERAGTASGLLGALQMGTGAALTVVTGALEEGTGVPTAITMFACGVIGLLALARARRYL
ncbi:multidrug effflux MFS transporter [Roseomonas sp. CCTCC AB2023176]|uniref:multidrug effflux MFS transporter n=1 Tax=Roseomonas sp. CCTCC AB2023176 TaxID=3342640 RepID=UPI0035E09359